MIRKNISHSQLAVLRQLQNLIDATTPEYQERKLGNTILYLYKSQPLIAYTVGRKKIILQTPGKTPKSRRKSMKAYMTITGNIKLKAGQKFPTSEIRNILKERKIKVDQKPDKRPSHLLMSQSINPAVPRHEKTAQRVGKVERAFPAIQKITRHPKTKHWVIPFATTIEVAAGLFAVLVLVPWVIALLPDFTIPLPTIDWPDILLPTINLPNWNLPFTIPDLPAWLDTLLYWFGKTLPIWIALSIALRALYKQKRSKNIHGKKDDEPQES